MARGSDPTVPLFLIGVLAVSVLQTSREQSLAERTRRLTLAAQAPAEARPFTRWSARELRSLPGLGERRAVAIVRARWSGLISGEPDSLDAVPGIGPETVATIRAELGRRAGRARE